MGILFQDLRYGIRMLLKNPAFTAVAVVTLALGIGASTAIFSVVNTVLLQPLAYPEPDRIVQFVLRGATPHGYVPYTSIPMFMVWREQTQAFQDIAIFDGGSVGVSLTGGDRPEHVKGLHVSADYFRLFGAPVAIGRTFSTEEDRPGGPRLAVISHGLWHGRFGADPGMAGKTVLLAGDAYEVIGVLGSSFRSDPPVDVWLPLQADPNSITHPVGFRAAARLRPDVNLGRANALMKVVEGQFDRKFPGVLTAAGMGHFTVEPLRDVVVGDARTALLVLLGAVGFVVLIAGVNVANLLLVRATSRRREMAIRVAIGAGRRRVVSQLLTESVLLSVAGGALGLSLGHAGVRALLAIAAGNIPRIGTQGSAVTLDWRVLVFTLLTSVSTGILFGLIPAFSATRTDLSAALNQSGSRSGTGLGQNKARAVLVIGETALALVLLTGAALLIRTFAALRTVDPGFDAHNVLTMEMSLTGNRFAKTAAVTQLLRAAGQRVKSLPGVVELGSTYSPPLEVWGDLTFTIEGRPLTSGQYHGDVEYRQVSPGYFGVLRISLRRGRLFTDRDDGQAPNVVLINEAMARQFWQERDPVGERITIGEGLGPEYEEPPREIVGIVADVRDIGLSHRPEPIMYVPVAQLTDGLTEADNAWFPIIWMIRTKAEPHSISTDVQEELRRASGGLPVAHIRSMEQVLAESTARTHFNMMLLCIFAGIALVLAAVGIYGLMAYSVEQRTHEIGVRMALGAQARNVLLLVLRRGLTLAMVGIAIGLFGAMWLTEAMKSLLFGVSPNDPLTFAAVSLLFCGVALLACYIPAHRATRVDPLAALHYE
jgi:predicted permease